MGALKKGTNMHRPEQTPLLEQQGSLSTTVQFSFFSSFKALKLKPSLVAKRKLK